jgi:hypothetical protein
MAKKSIYVCLRIMFVAVAIGGCSDHSCDPAERSQLAVLHTSMGRITVDLYTDMAKHTVANFVKLADTGFYYGLVFHRVTENLVIQTGSFDVNGTRHISPYGFIDLVSSLGLRLTVL